MKIYFSIALYVLIMNLTATSAAQNLLPVWQKSYDTGDFDYPSTVITGKDDNLLVCATRYSIPDNLADILLFQTDQDGTVLWDRTYGGEGHDVAVSALRVQDSCYLVIGYTNSFNQNEADTDIYLLKLTMAGDTLWTKTIGSDSTAEYAYSAILTSDNNIVITGLYDSFTSLNQDFLLLKIDPDGRVIWQKNYGGEIGEIGHSVIETEDNGFLIAGETTSFGPAIPFYTNIYLVRTDSNGDSLWTRFYSNTWYDRPRSISKAENNSYIVSGWYATNGTEVSDFYTLKVLDNGDTSWTHFYGGRGFDYCNEIIKSETDEFIMSGTTNSFGAGSYDVYLVKINTAGDTLWTKTIGSSLYENAKGMLKAADGNYFIYGNIRPNSISALSDILLMKVNLDGINSLEKNSDILPVQIILKQNYPNPFNPQTVIKFSLNKKAFVELKVHDLLGREIKTIIQNDLPAGEHSVTFNGADFASGVYIYTLKAGSYVQSRKMLLLR